MKGSFIEQKLAIFLYEHKGIRKLLVFLQEKNFLNLQKIRTISPTCWHIIDKNWPFVGDSQFLFKFYPSKYIYDKYKI